MKEVFERDLTMILENKYRLTRIAFVFMGREEEEKILLLLFLNELCGTFAP